MSNLNLFEVAENECYSILEIELKNSNFDINSHNKDGNTLLHIIASNNNNLIRKLISLGAKSNLQNKRKESVLHIVCGKGNLQLTKLLIESNIKIDLKDYAGETVLFKAVRNGHTNILNYFLEFFEHNSIYYELNNQNENLLNIAVKNGNLNLVRRLFDGKNFDVNHLTNDGWTNLYFSVNNNCEELTQFLIENGGDLSIKYSKFRTLLHVAIENKNYKLAKLLIETKKINLNSQDMNGSTPLHYAIELQLKQITILLLQNGADIKIEDYDGYNCLHLAVMGKNTDIVRLLMAYNGNKNCSNLKTFNGDLPLHLAASFGNLDGVILLNDEAIHSSNIDGYTALRLAKINCHKEVVNYLLNYKSGKRRIDNKTN